MQQQTFADVSFEQYRKPTRRERFLAVMEQVIPWEELRRRTVAKVDSIGLLLRK
jgi:hypothetical protein